MSAKRRSKNILGVTTLGKKCYVSKVGISLGISLKVGKILLRKWETCRTEGACWL